MNHPYFLEVLDAEYRKERLQQAEHMRMVKELEAAQAQPGLVRSAIYTLGSLLVRLGTRLEQVGKPLER